MRLSKLSGLKTLHKYLTGQVVASLLLTVAVFTFVLLLGNVLREILMLLIAGHGRLGIVAEAIVLLIPFVWVFALPMGLLTATLLVFGRFSADQELTAARASGISLISLIMPVLLLSLFCCVLSAWFSMDLGPRSRVKYLGLRTELLANLADFQWPEGRFINISTNYIFYAESIHGRKLENVMALCLDQNTYVEAPIGNIEVDSKNQQYVLNLIQARIVTTPTNGENVITSVGNWPIPVSLKSVKNQKSKPSISDMTFIELQEELRELQQRIPETASTNQTRADFEAARKLPEGVIEQVRVVMQRQLAFAFAPFGFALLGIPLGIRVHRRETNVGVAIALMLVILYYGFVMLAWQLSSRPECYPHLIVWAPNLIFQAVGAVLLWRANRGI
ncbi:MAG TPA: LptF/LptG family permease [Candidatus Acidoferrales bacterium]|nr:LptF/LptG family permease [Candidatus Acidoferrales bacterium]